MENKPWEVFVNEKQWEQHLKHLVRTNTKALCRAILLIYYNQTKSEMCIGKSFENNNKGFTKYDAYIMSKIAIKIDKGIGLTGREIAESLNRMPKYWKQLMKYSKSKIEMQPIVEAENKSKELDAILNKCQEQSIPCSYGICDECTYRNML